MTEHVRPNDVTRDAGGRLEGQHFLGRHAPGQPGGDGAKGFADHLGNLRDTADALDLGVEVDCFAHGHIYAQRRDFRNSHFCDMQRRPLHTVFMDNRHARLRWARSQKYRSAMKASEGMGVPYGTYSSHENGSRDYGQDEAERYGSFFSVDPSWLMTGRGTATKRLTPIVGQAGAGSDGSVLFAEGHGYFGEVPPPTGASHGVVALEVVGNSMRGMAEDGWIIFYDDVQPPSPSLFDEMCVCWLEDGRVLVKILQPGREPGLYDLESTNAPTMRDVPVREAALVTSLMPRKAAQKFVRRNPAFYVKDATLAQDQ